MPATNVNCIILTSAARANIVQFGDCNVAIVASRQSTMSDLAMFHSKPVVTY
jgi:hypothetical protein